MRTTLEGCAGKVNSQEESISVRQNRDVTTESKRTPK